MSIYCPLSMASDKPKVCIESDDKPLSVNARCYKCPLDSLEFINDAIMCVSIASINRSTDKENGRGAGSC